MSWASVYVGFRAPICVSFVMGVNRTPYCRRPTKAETPTTPHWPPKMAPIVRNRGLSVSGFSPKQGAPSHNSTLLADVLMTAATMK